MTNYDLEEDKLLKIQICLSLIFIFTIIISITLSYNSMMDCEKREKIYSDEDALNILRINRIIAFIVAVGFVIINSYDKSIKTAYNLNDKNADLQILASIITLISSLIVLYVAFSSSSEIIANENPES